MASHVVVLDSSARQAKVKTTPTKHLSDILQEACGKLGLDPTRHGLKNSKDKALDLSQPFRLSGLSSGAKLQLVVLSRSPSVVSVALQIPEAEAGGSSRLTAKFPSTMTLWLLLRQFESSAAIARNFTARGIAQPGNGGANGSGRLYYETPVIHVMGRELVSFTDLQKTLAQLGFNNGSVLLRLSFRTTETPLEEAMVEIDQYFKSVEGESIGGAHADSVGEAESTPQTSEVMLDKEMNDQPSPSEPPSDSIDSQIIPQQMQSDQLQPSTEPTAAPTEPSPLDDQTVVGPLQQPIQIYAPPSASTPAAARQPHNEKDFEPTIDHAKLHQKRLNEFARNKPLPSDAELAAQAEVQAKKNTDVKKVNIKVRFPDQTQVIREFTNMDTAAVLYDFVQKMMHNENEPFSLNFSSPKGPRTVPKDKNVKLIQGLGMVGAVLVNVVWEEGVSAEARQGKVLKAEYQGKAVAIQVKEPEGVDVEGQATPSGKGKDTDGKGGKEKKGGVPKWLKLPGKK